MTAGQLAESRYCTFLTPDYGFRGLSEADLSGLSIRAPARGTR